MSIATAPGMISTAMAGQMRPAAASDRRDQERPRNGADLVQCLVHAEAASQADAARRMSEQCGLGRAANRLPEPLPQDEDAGQRQPGAGEERRDGQSRYADRSEGVAGESQRPVAPACGPPMTRRPAAAAVPWPRPRR